LATAPRERSKILALAGGVGGARLANGLANCLPPEALTVVVNTGDDFELHGLHISPDLDTVMYTLAGLNDSVRGWGVNGETWAMLGALKRLGGEDWFMLGDQDIATHILRTERLRTQTLSAVTREFCSKLGIRHGVVPMTDDEVRTMVLTDEGRLPFQDYFVRRRCAPRFLAIEVEGAANARPSDGFLSALDDSALAAVVICPSNPLLSIRPILGLPGVTERLAGKRVPVVAVSPFIGGKAVKGPAAKILQELGLAPSPAGLLACYGDLIDALVIDHADVGSVLPDRRVRTLVTNTLMRDAADQARLAREVLSFIRRDLEPQVA
jgi:LPPG:FO 2-phospho-L-lactate transferase